MRDDPAPGERPRHTTRLMPLVSAVLEAASISWKDADRIAVGVGPGTFTGLRIGIATARALSRATGIPLVGVSTLESLALGALPDPDEPVSVHAITAVIDARRGEVFAAGWRLEGGRELAPAHRFLEPRALAAAELAKRLSTLGGSVVAVGDGAVEFREVLEQSGASIPDGDSDLHKVSAISHCRLAAGAAASGPDEIRPEYLRLPDAEQNRRTRDSK
jgi:tRNA threonylcarbamoyladenosine biosynthesis protein TsaB